LVAVAFLFISVGILLDGLRRIHKVLNEGETISKFYILWIALAYLTEVVLFVFSFSKKIGLSEWIKYSYVVDIAFVFANATLVTVFYRLSVD
jgi:hypothetical protein